MQPFAENSYPGRTADFWRLYVDILNMIARTAAEEGGDDLRYHEVTRLYEELIQTQKSSRWIISMTLASTIEALAKSIATEADRRAEFASEALESMTTHLRSWKGDERLRGRMLNNLARAGERSVLAFMNSLARSGALDSAQVETWRQVRNAVMHGELSEPWSTEEGDRHVQELIALAHALTRLRIAKG
jgi:hypothetical protein